MGRRLMISPVADCSLHAGFCGSKPFVDLTKSDKVFGFKTMLLGALCVLWLAILSAIGDPPPIPTNAPIVRGPVGVDPLTLIPPARNYSTTQGWLPERWTCPRVIPESPGTNLAWFYAWWRTNGDHLEVNINPVSIPTNKLAALEWTQYPEGQWYRLQCVTNLEQVKITNWAEMGLGFYRVRF